MHILYLALWIATQPTGAEAAIPLEVGQATTVAPEGQLPTTEGFTFHPGRMFGGRVYHYAKSNIDGSNPSRIDLFVASETRIEAFKYHEGYPEGTLVVAEMDWETFSVGSFATSKVHAGEVPTPFAELKTEGLSLVGKLGAASFRIPVDFFPWHTYDFDLASLNVALRFLEDPEGVVELGMVDQVRGLLAFKGMVELRFEEREERHGIACRRYSLDGPGLSDRGGLLWVRLGEDPILVDYEIALPDEPGMKSGKLRLLGESELTSVAWSAHMWDALR